MELDELYNQLWSESREKIRSGLSEGDQHIFDPNDDRYGITLLLRPTPDVARRISDFLKQLDRAVPGHYTYPASDLHVTVLSIISCYSGFRPDTINVTAYADVIQRCLMGIGPFMYHFRGLTASPSCLMLRGYFEGDVLNLLRGRLREAFGASSLRHSIDTRYRTVSGHSTVFRLRDPLPDPEAYLGFVQRHMEREFGTFRVDQLDLVSNDWFMRGNRCRLLHRFDLSVYNPGTGVT